MDHTSPLGSACVCRLGLATRGNTNPTADDVLYALERGINYWNWCGHEDGMSRAVRQLAERRAEVVVATQIADASWSRDGMWRKLEQTLAQLNTSWLDVVTLYYVESTHEWEQITAAQGALQALQEAKEQGIVRAIGLTSHQRNLAARWARSGMLDLLMIRYNAAHRGARQDVFPVTDQLKLPVVAFTCLRWGALLQPTPQDPHGFSPPAAPQWYRFVLSQPSVTIALMAPDNRPELEQNLTLLDDWRAVSVEERHELEAHGDRVRAVSGPFP